MVQAIINITEESNRVLNILKAKHGLKDKSAAIDIMAQEYAQSLLEPSLRPEYVKRALRIARQQPIKVGTVAKLRQRYA